MKHKISLLLVGGALLALALVYIPGGLQRSAAAASSELSGFAWSSNIGWISMEGSGYGVDLSGNINNGKLTGFAWSSNIGWISFDPDLATNEIGIGAPDGDLDPYVKVTGGVVTGWARACSVFYSGCGLGPLKPNTQRGDWDGWIRMDPTGNPTQDVHFDGNELKGYAWGSDVLGWVDFCSSSGTSACVSLDSFPVSCSGTILESGGISPTNPSIDVEWEAVPSGGTGPYTYAWTLPGGNPDSIPSNSSNIANTSYSSADTYDGTSVTVTDSVGGVGTGACEEIVISNESTPQLGVTVSGIGTVNYQDRDGNPVSCTNTSSTPSTVCGPDDYDLDDSVTLTRTAAILPEVFAGWGGACSGTGLTCTPNPLVMDTADLRWVYANYGAPVVGGLTAYPSVIGISRQADGVSAQSNKSTITWTGSGSIEVCLLEFQSIGTGNSIINIMDNANGHAGNGSDRAECNLGSDHEVCRELSEVNPGLGQTLCTVLDDDPATEPGNSADFMVVVPDKFIEMRENSPYQVKI